MIQKITKLFTVPTHELGKWSRFLVFQVRIWFHCLRLLKINRCGTQAAALAYHSIFGLVPLAIVGLMVFQMFPAFDDVSEKVKTFAYDALYLDEIEYPAKDAAADPEMDQGQVQTVSVAEKLDELTKGFISKASAGAITTVGIAVVIWAAISLLTTTERAFNNIYHVSTARSFLHRLFNYWALLTLGPILLGVGMYVSTQYLLSTELSQGIFSRLAPVIPFMISLVAFFFLYFFLPNTRVSPGSALWGAFVGTVLWTAAKIGFRHYIMNVPGFAVYGVLGIIPITVLWIFISWLIVLFGLQLTYATQNIKRLDAVELSRARRKENCFLANDQTVIRVMEYVLNIFEQKNRKPVSIEAVSHRLGMPIDFTGKILESMVRCNLLCQTHEPTVGYVPSTDGDNITLDEISAAISEISFAQADESGPAKMRAVFSEVRDLLSTYSLKAVLNKAEAVEAPHEPAGDLPAEEQPESGEPQL